MATPVTITDSEGRTPDVIDQGLAVSTSVVPRPASPNFLQSPIVISLSTDGTGIGLAADLSLVVGSLDNPIDAFVEAIPGGDLYFTVANIFIEDGGNISLEDFGAILGGLTNGLGSFIENEGVKFPITSIPLRTNLDLIRFGTLTAGLGEDASAFRGKQSQGGGDTFYNPIWDLKRLSAGGEGVVLAAGTNQRMGVTIQDDMTTLTSFNILFEGYIRRVD